MARDDGEQQAMTSERLAHWHWVIAKHFEPQSTRSVVIDVRDLAAFVAEVERLRAALDAQGKLVELLAAEAWYGSNAPYYAEMRRILETHKRAWHTLSESKQRSGGDGAC